MKISGIGMNRLLRASSLLVIAGLLAEVVSILWFHPLAFVLFVFVAAGFNRYGHLDFSGVTRVCGQASRKQTIRG